MMEYEVQIVEAVFHSALYSGLKKKDFEKISLPYLDLTEICTFYYAHHR